MVYQTKYDVAVVGAGPAGLHAAYSLLKAGKSVVIIEARKRVGGRTWNGRIRDEEGNERFIEIGGQWISPDQTRLSDLVAELGLETYQRYRKGKAVYISPDGTRHTYDGDCLPCGTETNAEIEKLIGLLDDLAARVRVEAPWDSEDAKKLDTIPFRDWLQQHSTNQEAIDNISIYMASGMLTKPSYSFSALQAALMAASAGSFSNLVDEDFILDRRVIGGMQSVSLRLAEKIEELGGKVILDAPVRRIKWAETDPETADELNGVAADLRNGVDYDGAPGAMEINTDKHSFSVKNAVLAVPPNLYHRIQYDPPMPREQMVAHQHISMGLVIKVHAVYPTPFWRDKGLSGTCFGGGRLVQELYDNTNVQYGADGAAVEDEVGTLVGFISDEFAEKMWRLPAEKRRETILEAIAEYLGPEALRPIAFYLSDMAAEEWTRGAYATSYDLGGLHRWGAIQNQPTGPIYYACSDIAAEGYQHVDGAVRQGELVAHKIIEAQDKIAG